MNDLVMMFSEKSGYVTCYNTNDIKRMKAKGLVIVEEKPKVVKTRKKRAKK